MDPATRVTEKLATHQNQHLQRRQQQVLKCPRCDSLNTKFCYYNNYSLAQPRHLCKACKRYWTRGGTLRNVPMGGGCRKNKRIKKTFTTTVDHNPNPNLAHSTPSNNHLNPLHGLLQRNANYPRFHTTISDIDASKYDLSHTKMNSFGSGFSSSNDILLANSDHNSMSLVSSQPSMFSGGFTSSSLQEQPGVLGFAPFGDECGSVVNDVQTDGTKSSMDCKNSLNSQNDDGDQIKPVGSISDDLTSFLWPISGGEGGEWMDPTSSMQLSIPSLI